MIKLFTISFLVSLVIIASTSLHATDAATYEQQNFKYVKEKIIKPLPGKTGWWYYMLKVCADDYHLAITEVVLSSDTEIVHEGVNSVIIKGKCSFYGAVMKAKNGSTLGYKITTTEEATQKILNAKQGKLDGINWSDISRYKFILGFY